MKHLLLVLLFSTTFVGAESFMDPATIDKKIEQTFFPTSAAYSPTRFDITLWNDVSWITDENRFIVIQKLRERYDQSGIDSPDLLEKVLVRAGDRDATRRMVEKIKDPRANTDALVFATEEIIPLLIPLICGDPSGSVGDQKAADIQMELEVRKRAYEHFRNRINDKFQLPQLTISWVWEGLSFDTVENANTSGAALAEWWKHNKTAILEKRYQDAKWLPYFKDPDEGYFRKMRETKELEMLAAMEESWAQGPATNSALANTSEEPLKISPARLERTTSKMFFKLSNIGIGIILGAVCCYLWHRLTTKTEKTEAAPVVRPPGN